MALIIDDMYYIHAFVLAKLRFWFCANDIHFFFRNLFICNIHVPANNSDVYRFICHIRFDVIPWWCYQVISTHPIHFVQAWGIKNSKGDRESRCKHFDLDLKISNVAFQFPSCYKKHKAVLKCVKDLCDRGRIPSFIMKKVFIEFGNWSKYHHRNALIRPYELYPWLLNPFCI